MNTYKFKLVKVVDGDTVDVDIDLGFDCWLHNQRIRIVGIDTPESRTSDKEEKVFGLLAKDRVEELLARPNGYLISKEYERGKFGRILGDFGWEGREKTLTECLLIEHLAVPYFGQAKDEIVEEHLKNREYLTRNNLVE